MIFPTTSVLSFSVILMAVLLAADWYVWGMTFTSNFRQPVEPCREVEGTPSATADRDANGFKKVA